MAETSTQITNGSSPVLGRIKSFSQKSGWGFIQLFEDGIEDSENCKDVFFHRADVARSGTCDLRPGILVNCNVLVTGKGEKACDINLVEEKPMGSTASITLTCMTCLGSSDDSLSHSPYASEITTINTTTTVFPHPSSYSSRSTDNYTLWQCTECQTPNAAQSIRRVLVVCASCGLVHSVQNWICSCSQANKRSSRHCAQCDLPYSIACVKLLVQSGQHAEEPSEELQQVAVPNRKTLRTRSRWQHGNHGWSHSSMEAPAASAWCQEGVQTAESGERSCRELRQEALLEKCRSRLTLAHDWLMNHASAKLDSSLLSKDWLRCFSEEVAKPKHSLLCSMQGKAAFVPNPCADLEDPNVPVMYEAIGMLFALALAFKMPLYPKFPMWMARSLLGYPTTLQDLEEFDPKLLQKVATVEASINVSSLKAVFKEEITWAGASRTFQSESNELEVTEENRHAYGMWLKDTYLSKSVESQMKAIKHGFFYALMGDHLMQSLTPVDFFNILNGVSC